MSKRTSPDRRLAFGSLNIFSLIFVFVFLTHAPLLRLPFFWDEAGFYVPAAHDILQYHTLVPQTSLDTTHPPLSAAYLAFWFALSGFKPAVARMAMLLLAAFALTNVFLLARRLAGTGVAVASTIATALYPIFFVQSSLVHADLAAAAFSLWGIRLSVERRLWPAQLAFSLAVLSKETAIVTPAAIAIWELLRREEPSLKKRFASAAIFALPALPLAAWLLYHHHVTGSFLGGPDFYRYNVTHTLSPLRFVLAFGLRLWHLFGIMNMLALTVATGVAMWFPPVSDAGAERDRIAVPVQLQFALIMAAHLIVFSIVGGALLTRYILPLYPLVIMIGMSTLHRRIDRWEWPAATMIIFFVLALFFDPPYRFSPEDNLTYRDFIILHSDAARFLERHESGSRVLTAWPATDELTRPYLGYVSQPFAVIQVRDFTTEELLRARQMRNQYQVAYLFSTKYEASTWFRSAKWEELNQRFFDYHRDLTPESAAALLEGRVVYAAHRKAEWVMVIEIESGGAVGSP